jgi:hypothetical protein
MRILAVDELDLVDHACRNKPLILLERHGMNVPADRELLARSGSRRAARASASSAVHPPCRANALGAGCWLPLRQAP